MIFISTSENIRNSHSISIYSAITAATISLAIATASCQGLQSFILPCTSDQAPFFRLVNANSDTQKLSKSEHQKNIMLSQSLRSINEIKELKKNWNGNDTEPFSSELISLITKITENLVVQPMIFPTGRNSIQLDYENDKNDYLEFEIFENSEKAKMFFLNHDDKNGTKHVDFDKMNNIIREFYE